METLDSAIFKRLLKRSADNKNGRVLSRSAMSGLVKEFGDPIEIRRSLHRLLLANKVDYSADSRGEPISAYIVVFPPEAVLSAHSLCWHSIIEDASLLASEREALAPLGECLHGFDKDEMHLLLEGLIRLRKEQGHAKGQLTFAISAAYLLGSSKLLSSLDARALKAFGIDTSAFHSRPPYVVVAAAKQHPISVILVENPVAFELAALSAACDHVTFICTFGFGLSNVNNEYGNQLANMIEAGSAIVLKRTGSCSDDLLEILNHPEVHFWGDLDLAGIQIYERIAKRLPHLQLSALYTPMIRAAASAASRHPYVNAVGKQGQSAFGCQRQDGRQLLEYCRSYAVDQEIVTEVEIESLAGQVLQPLPA
jgi:hypothetical protein